MAEKKTGRAGAEGSPREQRDTGQQPGQQARPLEERAAEVPALEVRIHRLFDREGSSMRASASVNIGGAFAVHGIRVLQSEKGLFVAMPSSSYVDGNGRQQYSSICHPVTAEARTALTVAVLKAYEQALESRQEAARALAEGMGPVL